MPVLIRRRLACAAAALAAGVLGLGAWRYPLQRRAPACEFELLDGRRINSADWLGQPALLTFWATSCTSCVAEMPQLKQLYRDFQPQGLQMLAVAMDYDRLDYVQSFARSRQLPFPVAHDGSGAAARLWGEIRATPTTLLLDRRSRIVQRIVGAPDFTALGARIGSMLQHS
jgi:peroxiredoxin